MLESLFSFVLAQSSQAPALGSGTSTVTDSSGLLSVGLFLLAVIVPFVLGKFLSTGLKMPTYAGAFSWILLAMIATGIVLATGTLKLGPDIKGGTNLIYQIDQTTVGNSGTRVTAKDFVAIASTKRQFLFGQSALAGFPRTTTWV